MKVIDLAEKQFNNEILPKHIRYENEDLYFDGVTYYDKEGNNDLFDILAMNYSTLTHLFDEVEIIEEQEDIPTISEEQFLFNQLNYEDTMEIIELMKKKIYKKEQEDKKIEKLEYSNGGLTLHYGNDDYAIVNHEKIIINKINELIEVINEKGDKNE